MKTSKVNIGLAPSRNFDKVTLEMIEEPIEYNSDVEFKVEIKKRFDLLYGLVDDEFKRMQK